MGGCVGVSLCVMLWRICLVFFGVFVYIRYPPGFFAFGSG